MPRCKYCGKEHYTVAEEIQCESKYMEMMKKDDEERWKKEEVKNMPVVKKEKKEEKKEEPEAEAEYEPVGGGKIYKFSEQGETLTGKILNIRDGSFKNKVYDILTDDGEAVTVFGTTILDRLMQQIQIGDEVRIKYVGDIPPKKKGMNPAKNFEVFRKKR